MGEKREGEARTDVLGGAARAEEAEFPKHADAKGDETDGEETAGESVEGSVGAGDGGRVDPGGVEAAEVSPGGVPSDETVKEHLDVTRRDVEDDASMRRDAVHRERAKGF